MTLRNCVLWLSTHTKLLPKQSGLSAAGAWAFSVSSKFSPEAHHPSIWRRGKSSSHASLSQELSPMVVVGGKRRPAEQVLCIFINQEDELWSPSSVKFGASLSQSPMLGASSQNVKTEQKQGTPAQLFLTTTAQLATSFYIIFSRAQRYYGKWRWGWAQLHSTPILRFYFAYVVKRSKISFYSIHKMKSLMADNNRKEIHTTFRQLHKYRLLTNLCVRITLPAL